MNLAQPKKKGKHPKKRAGLGSRLRSINLGDIGEAIGGAWDGIGKLTGFNTEIKRSDAGATPATITNTGTVASLSLIAEGADYNNREGHSIKALGTELRLTVANNAATTTGLLRAILFLDLEQNGTQPTPGLVLENALMVTAYAPTSPFNHDNTERFVILKDDLISTGLSGPQAVNRVWHVPLGTHIRYSGTTATDAVAREGHLYLLLISADAAAGPSVGFYNRLAYVDN